MQLINQIKSFLVILFLLSSTLVFSYPIDGYTYSGIKRILRLERILDGTIKDKMPIKGATLSIDSIFLNLKGDDRATITFDSLFTRNKNLQSSLNQLFPNLDESYSLALLDISKDQEFRYAARQENKGFQPGSIGKLAVATGLFNELQRLYPDDFEKRIALIKNKKVKAGKWAIPNIHTVPFFNPENNKLDKRLLVESDVFTLFEWVDHMLSVSSNGAASVVWREAILISAFCENYENLTFEQGEEYFKTIDRKELSDLGVFIVNEPLRELHISEDEFRLGTFFTRGGSDRVTPQGGSIASPKGMMKWLYLLEKGRVIDEKSSLEIKRLMYMTDRRIRYAANASLKNDAVYFKSGSLYQCRPEDGFTCAKYMGNKNNFMNSVAIIEKENGKKYIVALMTNVLKKNSNNDHNRLAGQIDALIAKEL
jgi:hypothetical protein